MDMKSVVHRVVLKFRHITGDVDSSHKTNLSGGSG